MISRSLGASRRSASLLLLTFAAVSGCKGGSAAPEPTSNAQPSVAPPPAAPAHEATPGHSSPGLGAPSAFDPAHPEVAGVRFVAPEPFVYQRPSSGMRAAEYVVPGGEGEKPAVLAISHFPGMGGSLDANIERWVGQFTQPDGRSSKDVAKIEQANVNGLAVMRVDVSGTFGGGMQMPGAPAAAPEPNQRLLGAIVTGPNGPVFFKLVGSAASVERVAPAFSKLLESVAPAK